MSVVSDFVGRVADTYRGATPAATAHVHGGGYQSPNPAVAAWLDSNPEVSNELALISNGVAALEGIHEGLLSAFDKARERTMEARAAEARLHHDAREMGKAADPEVAKRLLTTRKSATANAEEAAARLTLASNGFAVSRDVLNASIKYVGGLAAERRSVVMASQVTLPKGSLSDIAKAQRQTIADLAIEKAIVESAPPPLEDAITMLRASVAAKAPTIELSPRRVSWSAPKAPLNAAPRFGEGQVEIDDAVAMLAWLFPEVVADRLEVAVRARYTGGAKTFTPAERISALNALAKRREAAEAVEVAAIKKAWSEGQYIPLRANTTPAVLLGIAKVGEATNTEPEGYAGSAYLGQSAR